MRDKIKYVVICLMFLPLFINAQNTVGLISYEPDKSFDGFNLIYPHNQPNVYLLNNCGELVHVWEDDIDFRPGNVAILSDEGLLYKSKRSSTITSDPIWAGGGSSILEIRDWDNNLIWDFEMNDSLNRLHHDFAVTDDGTIIAIAWEYKSTDECIAAGRDTSSLAQKVMWPDWVFEIDPETDEIIWEWHAWDHLVQDFDENQANFGVIAEHPELIDVNYGRVDGHPDWMHANSLDYNEELEQIMISIPYFDEIWIIDKTTDTEEASGSIGGLSGKGGDLMYRWGNPFAYQNGDSTDQMLFFQHDAHWVNDHLNPSTPNYGKIAVFNNRIGEDFSAAHILDPGWDMYNWSYPSVSNRFLPEDYNESFYHPDTTALYSTGLSSFQLLQNGNTLITSGRFGYSFEMMPNQDIVWEFITPRKGTEPATQGDTLMVNQNLTFRMERLPVDFKGFDGKDLEPKGWIELEPDSNYCERLVSVMDPMQESNFKLFPNPTQDLLTVEWDGMMYVKLRIFDMQGKLISSVVANGGRKYLDVSNLLDGIYILSFEENGYNYSRRFIIQTKP